MSPVSRGRRPKKGGKRKSRKGRTDAVRLPAGPSGSPLDTLTRCLGGGDRPEWFDGAIDRVLTGANALTAARDGRELDQRVAELVGAQLHAALQVNRSTRFGWWYDELVDATIERVEQGDGPEREASVRLLHGLAAQGVDLPTELLRRARNAVPDQPTGLPGWLAAVPRIRATGEVRRLRDTYGTRMRRCPRGTSWS